MNLDKTVLELGQIPFQIFPKLNTIIKVQRNHKIINKRYPSNTLENEHQGKLNVILLFIFQLLLFSSFLQSE
jgi:hypothetical protein